MKKQPGRSPHRFPGICLTVLVCASTLVARATTEPASQLQLGLKPVESTGNAPERSYILSVSNGSNWPMSLRLNLEPTDRYRLQPLQEQPVSIQPGQTTPLYRLELEQPGPLDRAVQPYLESITGSLDPAPDQPLQLPCACDTPCAVSQASMGDSHQGWQRHAVDFYLPERSPVHAVSDGVVVEVRQDSDRTCTRYSPECDEWVNSITVRTREGGLVEYAHLHYRGARVAVGQVVKAGDLLALSGNTGYSLGPHLHLAMLGVDNKLQRQTFAMPFKHRLGTGLLQAGRTYRRTDCSHSRVSLAPTGSLEEPPA